MGSLTARAPIVLAALAALAAAPAAAASGVQLTRIATVRQPSHIAQPPGDPRRLYVAERRGRVRVTSFGEDGAGHVYATSFQGGVFRLDPA